MHRVTCILLLAATCALPLPAAAQRRALSIDDLAKVRELGDAQISPDGAWIAYVVTLSDTEKDKRQSDLWMVSWDGAGHVRLTSSPESESAPRWSPDGRSLAFLASRGDEEEKKTGAQVWLLNRAGGEAEQVTNVKGGITEFAWSPDSRRLVLAADDPDPDEEPEKKAGWKRKTKPPIVIDRYRFKEDRDGYLGRLRSHLYLFTLETRAVEALTSGHFDEESPSWSPDGRSIAFVSDRSPDPDRAGNSDIWVIEAKPGATPRKLTTFEGPDEGKPRWSPDGRFIAYLQGDEARYYAYHLNKLAVIPADGGEARVLTAALDRAVGNPEWSADGKSVYFLIEDDRTQHVARIAAAGGAIETLTSGRRVVQALSTSDNGRLAVLSASTTEPFEVYAVEPRALRRLSKQNDDWLKDVQLAATEDVTFTAKDGTIVNGLLSKPPSYDAGRRYPFLLNIHGGPNGQDEHAFDFEREWLAANGYVVLQVNYRGSSGRGSQFQKTIYGDWGHLEVVDLLAGADWAIAQGIADPERLGLGGWSYGGILTNYTIATDPRFKAAVSGASSSLQTSMYGTDQYTFQYDLEMGQPWKKPDAWLKVSYPFFKADRIRTPTLFLCGEKDFNVPVAGVEQMYQALKSMQIETELVIYPDQFHTITIPSYQRDRLQRYVAWYDKYLKTAPLKTEN
jgi:dipeptidyl aminopeptidase/acylaminoacyl peptidase